MSQPRSLVFIGGGGHARVLLDIARLHALPVRGVCDPALANAGLSCWEGLPVLGDDGEISQHDPRDILLVNAVGSLPGKSFLRQTLYENWKAAGYDFATLVHPSAILPGNITYKDSTGKDTGSQAEGLLAEGVQVMAGVIIQPGTRIGENTILNTRVSIDHDCEIGPHCHLSPGAVLCGHVRVGAQVHIGAGATLVQSIQIGQGAVVGAGTVLVRDLEAGYQRTGPALPPARKLPVNR